MLSTTNDNNESKNLLAGGRTLNFLNNSLQKAVFLMNAIILMILFRYKIRFLLSAEFPPKTMSCDMMEWK
jgi:hypothetical protein